MMPCCYRPGGIVRIRKKGEVLFACLSCVSETSGIICSKSWMDVSISPREGGHSAFQSISCMWVVT